VPLEFSGEASSDVADDPELAADAEAVAYGIAAEPAGEQLLVVAVTRLRADAFDDAFFRMWRDRYDVGACEPAGGVREGRAEAEIDGRNVFIGSCVNGGNTYHVWLEGSRLVVSAVSFGDRRLGERLMATLRE
jgi:hypothetical protein